MTKAGLELYAIRDLDGSVADHVRVAADLGYEGVAFMHDTHGDMDPAAVADSLDDTGLEAVSVAVDRNRLQRGIGDIVDLYGEVGVRTLVYHPRPNNWTERRARDMVELLRRTAIQLDDIGWRLVVHPNHWDLVPPIDWPVVRQLPWIGIAERLDRAGLFTETGALDWLRLNESRARKAGNILLDLYRENSGLNRAAAVSAIHDTVFGRYLALDPDLLGVMLDVQYPPIRGFDLSALMEFLGDRVEHVHLVDGCPDEVPAGRWPPFCPLGSGDIDLDRVMETAAAIGVEWIDISFNTHDPAEARAEVERGAELLAAGLG